MTNLFLANTASNMPEWVRKAAAAVNFLLRGAARVQNIAEAPANPDPGTIYFDTTTKKLRYWNETAWVDL